MIDYTRSDYFKLKEENTDYKLYTYIVARYIGETEYFWLEGTKEAVFERMHKIFTENTNFFPKFVRVEANDDGTVIYKGTRLISLCY